MVCVSLWSRGSWNRTCELSEESPSRTEEILPSSELQGIECLGRLIFWASAAWPWTISSTWRIIPLPTARRRYSSGSVNAVG